MSEKYIVIHLDKEDNWVNFLIIDTLDKCRELIKRPQILEDYFGSAKYKEYEDKVVSVFSELMIKKIDGIPDYKHFDLDKGGVI